MKCAALKLTSPADGVVLTADLDVARGLYLPEGSLFCEILPTTQINILIALTEDQAGVVNAGQSVELRIYSLPAKIFRGTVKKTFTTIYIKNYFTLTRFFIFHVFVDIFVHKVYRL